MSRERKIEEAVEKTLQSFESAERLQPSPFFIQGFGQGLRGCIEVRLNGIDSHLVC